MSHDELLYTGIHSRSTRTRREVANEEKIEKQAKLIPAAQVVLEAIEKEKEKTLSIKSIVLDANAPEENVKSQLLAQKYYYDYLVGLQNTMTRILSAKPIKKPEAKDE